MNGKISVITGPFPLKRQNKPLQTLRSPLENSFLLLLDADMVLQVEPGYKKSSFERYIFDLQRQSSIALY